MNALTIIDFERYDGGELRPVNRFRIENESALTVWDVTITQRGDDEWFLTMIDFTHCCIGPSNGTIWRTQEAAFAEAIDVALFAGQRTAVAV